MRFRLPLKWEGKIFNLAVDKGVLLLCKFVKLRDGRCPREVVCFWEGDFSVTLRVADQEITLNDHDMKWSNVANVFYEGHRYKFQGLWVDNGDFLFSVE